MDQFKDSPSPYVLRFERLQVVRSVCLKTRVERRRELRLDDRVGSDITINSEERMVEKVLSAFVWLVF